MTYSIETTMHTRFATYVGGLPPSPGVCCTVGMRGKTHVCSQLSSPLHNAGVSITSTGSRQPLCLCHALESGATTCYLTQHTFKFWVRAASESGSTTVFQVFEHSNSLGVPPNLPSPNYLPRLLYSSLERGFDSSFLNPEKLLPTSNFLITRQGARGTMHVLHASGLCAPTFSLTW